MSERLELQPKQEKYLDTLRKGSKLAQEYLESRYLPKSIDEVMNSKLYVWTPVDLQIKDRHLTNPEVVVDYWQGEKHVFFRCQDKRFPKGQYIGGSIETINGEKLSTDEILKRLVSQEEVRIKLAGSQEEIVLKNPSLSEHGVEYHRNLGIKYSRWKMLGSRPGVNIDKVSQGALAAEIGLRERDVILGATYVDSSGKVCKEIFETKRELSEFLGRVQVMSSDHRRIQFIVKRPEQTREEVLKSVEEGSKAALTKPVFYDRFNRRFAIDN